MKFKIQKIVSSLINLKSKTLCAVLIFIVLCWPSRFAMFYYENYSSEEIYENLIKLTINSSSMNAGIECDYNDLLEENHFFYKPFTYENVINKAEILKGGEFRPEDCNPSFSTAVIVPYRNRPKQLQFFLAYFHNYLRKQHIHYKIYIIEQADNKQFNRAKLFNIGAKYAIRDNFPCLIMHDVDLMPLRLGNIYACTHRPRHMSSSLDNFRFNLPYYGLFGGVVALPVDIFIHINGFSNLYWGWGGEDDDLYARLVNKNYKIIRFHPSIAQYTMLKHHQETPSPDRLSKLYNGHLRFETDGLNSLVYREIAENRNNLYTHVLVEI